MVMVLRVWSVIAVYSAVAVIVSSLAAVASGWTLPSSTMATATTRTIGEAVGTAAARAPSRCLEDSAGTQFTTTTRFRTPTTTTTALSLAAANTDDSSTAASITDEVSAMRLSEIKSELKDRGVDFSDCFDKESMVARLAEARANNIDRSEKDGDSAEDDEGSTTTATPPSPKAGEEFDRAACLEELQGMRVRALREELGRRGISRAGLFEKEDLVGALLDARAVAAVFSGTGLMTPGAVAELSETDARAEIDHPGSLLLLDVYATWCGPCQMIAPILQEIAAEQGDQLRVVKVNSDENPALSSSLKINGLPTLVLYRGGNEIDRLEGAPTKEQLVGWIESRR